MQKYLISILTLTILSCSCNRNLVELSELKIKNRKANRLIVDRKPDYGDGHRDGCIVMQEISMNINKLNDNSIGGQVFDSKTKKPLFNAELNLFLTKNGQMDTTAVLVDSVGIFRSKLNGNLEKIIVQYIAYRDLIIDFDK